MPESNTPDPKPWSLLLEYLWVVRKRWVGLMTGSLIVAVYAILVVGYPAKEHWWNQMPQWVVWLLVLLAVVAAQYRTWLAANARIHELEASRPRLSACLRDRGTTLLLAVTNDGALAKVWAKVTIIGDTSRPVSNVPAAWKDELGDKVEIATGESKDVIIAETHSGGPTDILYYWFVPFISDGARDSARALSGTVPSLKLVHDSSKDEDAATIRQRVSLNVFSDPTSLSPAIQCSITLVGCDLWDNLSGVPLCPESTAKDPSEQWQDFYREASNLLILLNSLRDPRASQEHLDWDWRVFEHTAREALSRAGDLEEPYKEQGRNLVRPFVGVDKSALPSCSGAAANLGEWLEETNLYVLKQRWSSPPPATDPPSTTGAG